MSWILAGEDGRKQLVGCTLYNPIDSMDNHNEQFSLSVILLAGSRSSHVKGNYAESGLAFFARCSLSLSESLCSVCIPYTE